MNTYFILILYLTSLTYCWLPIISKTVTFEESMGKYKVAEHRKPLLRIIQNVYKKNSFLFGIAENDKNHVEPFGQGGLSSCDNLKISIGHTKIPKKIHAIWLGSTPPASVLESFESFKKMHPDWECILWQDKDIRAFGLQNQHFYDNANNYGQRSDIARYELLYRLGGVYVDSDFKCLKSFDYLHEHFSFYTGVLKIGKQFVGLANGLIGSVPGHPILKQCIDSMNVEPHEKKKKITQSTGPGHFTNAFMAVIGSCSEDTVVLPSSFFYPAPNSKRHQSLQEMDAYIKPESFAIHYWTNSWKESKAAVTRTLKENVAKVLVLAPHPDDDILGCGGTIAHYCKKKDDVSVVFITSGEKGSKKINKTELAAIREQEALAAEKALGCSTCIFLRCKDGQVNKEIQVKKKLEELINKLCPDYIYIPHAQDDHKDHIATHMFIVQVLKEMQKKQVLGCQLCIVMKFGRHCKAIHT